MYAKHSAKSKPSLIGIDALVSLEGRPDLNTNMHKNTFPELLRTVSELVVDCGDIVTINNPLMTDPSLFENGLQIKSTDGERVEGSACTDEGH